MLEGLTEVNSNDLEGGHVSETIKTIKNLLDYQTKPKLGDILMRSIGYHSTKAVSA